MGRSPYDGLIAFSRGWGTVCTLLIKLKGSHDYNGKGSSGARIAAAHMQPRDESRSTTAPAPRWRRKSRSPRFWDRRLASGMSSRSAA
jgi:hypothetical protein